MKRYYTKNATLCMAEVCTDSDICVEVFQSSEKKQLSRLSSEENGFSYEANREESYPLRN